MGDSEPPDIFQYLRTREQETLYETCACVIHTNLQLHYSTRYDNAMRVDNHGIQWRGVCNNTLTQNQWRKKIMMKKGKKWRRKENEKKKSVAGWI